MEKPTLVISDTHLGDHRAGGPRVADLLPLLEGVGRLIINGDAAELQDPVTRGPAARQVLDLQLVCERLGVELTLLSGNHDAYTEDRRHVRLSSGRVLVTHGDVLHPAVVPWADPGRRLAKQHAALLDALPESERDSLTARLAVSRHVGHDEFMNGSHGRTPALLGNPLRLAAVLWYWWRAPSYAAAFAERFVPDAQFVLIGHSHRQGVWRRGGRTVINTGSFHWPGKPQAVLLDADELRVHAIDRRADGVYTFRPTPHFLARDGRRLRGDIDHARANVGRGGRGRQPARRVTNGDRDGGPRIIADRVLAPNTARSGCASLDRWDGPRRKSQGRGEPALVRWKP